MTRKHYVKIAAILAEQRPNENNIEAHNKWEEIVYAFSRMAKEDNPRFDIDRFLRACRNGVEK